MLQPPTAPHSHLSRGSLSTRNTLDVCRQLRRINGSAAVAMPARVIRVTSAAAVDILRAVVQPLDDHIRAFSSKSSHGHLTVTRGATPSADRLELVGRVNKIGYGTSVNGADMLADGARVQLFDGDKVGPMVFLV